MSADAASGPGVASTCIDQAANFPAVLPGDMHPQRAFLDRYGAQLRARQRDGMRPFAA
jgi:hypothetical protein